MRVLLYVRWISLYGPRFGVALVPGLRYMQGLGRSEFAKLQSMRPTILAFALIQSANMDRRGLVHPGRGWRAE